MPPKKKTEAVAAAPAEKKAPFFASMSLALLRPNDYNARRFEENMTPQRQARFDDLVASVREKGILEPLLVRLINGPGEDVQFEVVAGERRYRAACKVADELIGRDRFTVPCMVHDLDDDAAFDIMVVENLQREDLTPFETAQAFRAWLERHGNTADAVVELSARTGIPAHGIRRMVRLLNLPEPVLAALKEGTLTQSHAELFTRLADEAQIVELLAACLRLKLSVRELAERIGAIAPELDKAFFDKSECQTCHHNTAVQSGLFGDVTPGGRCGNPACFEAKQEKFFTENWKSSKAAEKFETNGFRFGHRLPPGGRQEMIIGHATAERCKGCDEFVTLLRVTGAVVAGYERTCIGSRECYEEMYCPKPVPEVQPETSPDDALMKDVNGCGRGRESCPADDSTCPDCLDPGPEIEPAPATETPNPAAGLGDALKQAREQRNAGKTEPTPPAEETGPVFDARRGERFREAFIKEVLPDVVNSEPSDRPDCLRLVLTALALSSTAVKTHLVAGMGLQSNIKHDQLAAKIFEIPIKDVPAQLVGAGLAHILNDFTLMPAVRQLVAEKFDVQVAKDWKLNEAYLNSLTKSEIVRIGEEPGVNLWKDEKLMVARREKHKGKGLMSLGKPELVDLILNSGVDLTGRVPREVLGQK